MSKMNFKLFRSISRILINFSDHNKRYSIRRVFFRNKNDSDETRRIIYDIHCLQWGEYLLEILEYRIKILSTPDGEA